MKRFLSGALPFYALAGLAMCMYLVFYRTNLFDLNAIVRGATGSSWFLVFMFVCVLLESVFPYFGYFPGTALILMSVALNPKSVDVSVFIAAWLAIIVGAVAKLWTGSLLQSRSCSGLLRRRHCADASPFSTPTVLTRELPCSFIPTPARCISRRSVFSAGS